MCNNLIDYEYLSYMLRGKPKRPKYCSAKCRAEGIRLIVAGRRKRGIKRKFTKGGCYTLYLPEHPMANSSGEVAEHRYIMSVHLGRMIGRDEEVHHKNHDTTDNRIENLEVLTKAQHFEVHRKERFQVKRAPWVIEKMKESQRKWTIMAQEKPCLVCGEDFKPQRPHQVYCSHSCWSKTRNRRGEVQDKNCLWCDNVFQTSDSRKLTCSPECRNAYKNLSRRKPKVTRYCKDCGAKIGDGQKVFCSKKCYKHYYNTVVRRAWRASKKLS